MTPLLITPLLLGLGGDPSELPLAESLPHFRFQEAAAPASPWKGDINFGLLLTEGNSESFTMNFNANAVRETEKHRWTLGAFYNYGEQTNDVGVKVNNIADGGASAKYDYKASEKYYYYGNAFVKSDDIADLDIRYIVGGGAGYQFKQTETVSWAGEGGLSYVAEEYDGTTPPEDDSNETIALRLASNLGYKMSDTARFEQNAEAYPSLEDSDDYYARFDNRLVMTLTDTWKATLQYVLDYDNLPAPGAQKADHRIV